MAEFRELASEPGQQFRLLGPVEVWAAGRLVDTGQPRQRCVLAALLVDAGRPVPWPTLVDRVWGERPPPRARHSLYSHIARIRGVLASAAAAGQPVVALRRHSGGYVLEVEPVQVDLHRFRGLVAAARDPAAADEQRVAALREALALWRGEPLAGLSGQWAAMTRDAWRQQYLTAVVAWAQAEVGVGNPAAVIEPVGDLVRQHPLAEPLAAVLMRALHAAGQTARALQCYVDVRTRLADELGADPSPELRELHRAILRGGVDPVRPAAAGVAVAAAPAPPAAVLAVPAQLPAHVAGFVGRRTELTRLDALLAASEQRPTAVVIAILSGTAGVGKTALALHWGHRVAARFPDGQLYVNLRGFDPDGSAMSPGEAVRGFLDAFGVPPQRIPPEPDAQVGLYRSLLAGRRVLVVLDNARDADQVRPLLPGAPGCMAVVTSRNQLAGLVAAEGAHLFTLSLLTAAEARHLLSRRLGATRVAAEPRATDKLISSCARLPLGLAIVAARAAAHPAFPLAALADELREARGSLDAFAGADSATDVRAVFSWSYLALTADAARLFRLLGLHPGPDGGVPAVASLAGLPAGRVRPLLAELACAHLVAEQAPGRYVLHDLLRAYAAELAQTVDSDQERRSALHRVLDHYLHTALAANRLLDPHREPIALTGPVPGVIPARVGDHGEALAWFTGEHAMLLAAIRSSAEHGFDRHVWQLSWTLTTFLERRGHWRDWAFTQRAALDAGRRLGDREMQAAAHRGMGLAAIRLGRHDEAGRHLRHALDLIGDGGSPAGRAAIHMGLSHAAEGRGDHRDALRHSQQALALYEAAGHRVGYARGLNTVGWHHARLGDHREAVAHCERALALLVEIGDRASQAFTLDSLGYAYHHLGHHVEATDRYRQALELFQDLGHRYNAAGTLTRLGDTRLASGDGAGARGAWHRALEMLVDLGHPDADQVRGKLATLPPPRGRGRHGPQV